MFDEYIPLEKAEITGLGNQPVKAHGCGTVTLNFKVNSKIVLQKLTDVLHVPNATNNLLSIGHIDATRGSIQFSQKTCIIKDTNENLIGTGSQVTPYLYIIDACTKIKQAERSNQASELLLSWDELH